MMGFPLLNHCMEGNRLAKGLKDPVSGLTHLAGAIMSVIGLVVLLRAGIANEDLWQIVSFSIFGASLILLYSASAAYHLLNVPSSVELVLRKLDHIMIFVLIAGTYTPVCLGPLRGATGYVILTIIWALAIAGVFFKVFYLNAPRWLYTGIYLAMGWLIIFATGPLVRAVGLHILSWLLIGGVFYSIGAVIYGLKKPDPFPGRFGFHEIFYIFILLGSLSHFRFIHLLA